jgi:mRNA interferase RelE/StbE
MGYGLGYTQKSLDFLGGLPKKQRGQVIAKVDRLKDDARPAGCKLFQGETDGDEPIYRIRSGDYRVLYVLRESTITVLDIDHRKDIYR